MNIRLPKVLLGLTLTIFALGSLCTTTVGAETSSANAAQGLEISPTLVELNAMRGNTYTIKLKLRNVTASDLQYSASVDDFAASDETGSPHILVDSKLPVTASIKTWFDDISTFVLKSQQSFEVQAQVTIPKDAEPGGHYGVLRFSGAAPEIESTGVGLSASAGVLILIRVDGDIVEKASLASFFSAGSDGKQSSMFEYAPVTLVTRVKNDGNIHVKPVGSIELKDMFGNIVKTIPVNNDKSNVLPDSIRRFESKYDTGWMVGRYTASLTIGYGTTGQALTSTINFWVIPYKIIGAGILVLATIIFIFKRLIAVYNRRIIEKAKNEIENKNKHNKRS